MKIDQIFLMQYSVEDDRPHIDFEDPRNGRGAHWATFLDVFETGRPAGDSPTIRLFVEHSQALQWHFYGVGSTAGLLSQDAIKLLRPYMDHFDFFPGSINDTPFFFPRCRAAVDCLDYQNAKVEYFADDPKKNMRIRKYAFREVQLCDPVVFCLPGRPHMLYVTHSIKAIVDESGYKGFDFTNTQNLDW